MAIIKWQKELEKHSKTDFSSKNKIYNIVFQEDLSPGYERKVPFFVCMVFSDYF